MAYGSLTAIGAYISQPGSRFNFSNTGTYAKSGKIFYNLGSSSYDANGVTADRAQVIDRAIQYVESITGVDFIKTTNSSVSDIDFTDDESGAFARSWSSGGNISHSQINIAANWGNGGGADLKSGYLFQTVVHELLHTFGLEHPGNYNGTATFPSNATFDNDSWQNSIMSYFSQTENTNVNASYAYIQTAMAADFIALQNILAGQSFGTTVLGTANAFTGNTVYGFNTNISIGENATLSDMSKYATGTAYCIVDSGGYDRIDVSGWSVDQKVDIRPTNPNGIAPTSSDIAGLTGNLTLAAGTIIEEVVTGAGNDLIFGNGTHNRLWGGAGNDTIYGGAGNDEIWLGSGSDIVYGGDGGDGFVIDGYNYGDMNFISGGAGIDVLRLSIAGTYSNTFKVDLRVAGYQNTGFGYHKMIGVENIVGGAGKDFFIGNGANNAFAGNAGNDWLVGAVGDDTLYGGEGNDILQGGVGNDRLVGAGGNDLFYIDPGNDILVGGAGFDKVLHGGPEAVHFDLGRATITSATNGTDAISGIELVRAGSGHDTIYGSNSNDVLIGAGGNDTIVGRFGHDRLYGDQGNDVIDGGDGADLIVGGAGADRLVAGVDNFRDVFKFNSVSDSTVASRDLIFQFDSGEDVIDLTAIDANINAAGDQAFTWGGASAGAYSVWMSIDAGTGRINVMADNTGDGIADFSVQMVGSGWLSYGDFLL